MSDTAGGDGALTGFQRALMDSKESMTVASEAGSRWEARKRIAELEAHLARIKELVDQQAADEALWFKALFVTEIHLQQELRRLHAVIEGE